LRSRGINVVFVYDIYEPAVDAADTSLDAYDSDEDVDALPPISLALLCRRAPADRDVAAYVGAMTLLIDSGADVNARDAVRGVRDRVLRMLIVIVTSHSAATRCCTSRAWPAMRWRCSVSQQRATRCTSTRAITTVYVASVIGLD
jgi:hypothetical protein